MGSCVQPKNGNTREYPRYFYSFSLFPGLIIVVVWRFWEIFLEVLTQRRKVIMKSLIARLSRTPCIFISYDQKESRTQSKHKFVDRENVHYGNKEVHSLPRMCSPAIQQAFVETHGMSFFVLILLIDSSGWRYHLLPPFLLSIQNLTE